jgi:ABC-type dipeptide/oligopeptide/nickel transport system ATPase component
MVESGTTDEVLHRPSDGYTRELVAAVPRVGAGSAP